MFYVVYLSEWDEIVGKPTLPDVRPTIPVVTAPVTIQPPGTDRLAPRMWRGNLVTEQKSALSTAPHSMLARVDELAVRAAELENQFNPLAECATLFPNEIPREL